MPKEHFKGHFAQCFVGKMQLPLVSCAMSLAVLTAASDWLLAESKKQQW